MWGIVTIGIVSCGPKIPDPPGPAFGEGDDVLGSVPDTTPPRMIPDPRANVGELFVPMPAGGDSLRARQLIAEGRALRNRHARLDAAADRFEAAWEADTSAAAALWELGETRYQQEDWDAALDAWRRMARRGTGWPGLDDRMNLAAWRRDRERFLAGGSPPPVEDSPRQGPLISISAVGDIQLGTAWPEDRAQVPPNAAADLFAQVTPLLDTADITFGNLETVLGDYGESTKCRRGSRNCYAFRAPAIFASTLRRVGFDVVSANNNHAGDFGDPGRYSTVRALDLAGLHHSGPVSGVASWETRGVRFGMIAFSTGEGPFRVPDIDAARQTVMEADRRHDILIVSFHAGAEGSRATRVPKTVERAYGENRGDVYAFAHAMVDAGADLLLGHGPHVLRGMEIYRGRFIAYSLGNFSAWHGFNLRGPLGRTVVLTVTLAPNGVVTAASIDPIVIDQPGIPRLDPERQAVEIVRRLSREDLGWEGFGGDGSWRR